MKIIVISGKSGSGKTVVAETLSEFLNATMLSLDEISHLSLEDEEIKDKLFSVFGNDVFDNKKIDRKKLGKIIFENRDKLDFVNNLSWKFIDDYVDNFIEKHKNKNFIILDYALITKMKYFEMADYKILVESAQNDRFDRLIKRDNVTFDYLNLREKNSLNFASSDFDYVLKNDSSIEKLKFEALKIAKKIQI